MNFKKVKVKDLKVGDVILDNNNHLLKIEMLRKFSDIETAFYFTNNQRQFIKNEDLIRTCNELSVS